MQVHQNLNNYKVLGVTEAKQRSVERWRRLKLLPPPPNEQRMIRKGRPFFLFAAKVNFFTPNWYEDKNQIAQRPDFPFTCCAAYREPLGVAFMAGLLWQGFYGVTILNTSSGGSSSVKNRARSMTEPSRSTSPENTVSLTPAAPVIS